MDSKMSKETKFTKEKVTSLSLGFIPYWGSFIPPSSTFTDCLNKEKLPWRKYFNITVLFWKHSYPAFLWLIAHVAWSNVISLQMQSYVHRRIQSQRCAYHGALPPLLVGAHSQFHPQSHRFRARSNPKSWLNQNLRVKNEMKLTPKTRKKLIS